MIERYELKQFRQVPVDKPSCFAFNISHVSYFHRDAMGGQFEEFYFEMGRAIKQKIRTLASIVNGQTFDIEYRDKISNLVRSMEGIFGNMQYDLFLTLTQNIDDEVRWNTLNREIGSQTYFEHYNDLSQFYLYSGKYKQAFLDGFNENTADSTTMAVNFTTGEELSTTHHSLSVNDLSSDQKLSVTTTPSDTNLNDLSTDQELSVAATSSDEKLQFTATSSSTMSMNTVSADEELSVTASSSSGMNVTNLSKQEEIVGFGLYNDFEEEGYDEDDEAEVAAVLEYIDQLWTTYQNSSHYMQDLQDGGFVDKIYIEYELPHMFISVFNWIYIHMHDAVIDTAHHVDQTSNMAVITTEYMR